MPKSYSEQEREYIRKKLKEEAADCITRYGIRRTTVDEIVKRVKIPKGTFYLFYPSKEMLLFDVILEQHNLIEQRMYQAIKNIDTTTFSAKQFTDIVFEFFKAAEDMPLLKLLNSDEIEILARKLPPEMVRQHLGHDSDIVEKMFSFLPLKPGIDILTYGTAFQAIYLFTLHKEKIGERYDEVLKALIYGLALQVIN